MTDVLLPDAIRGVPYVYFLVLATGEVGYIGVSRDVERRLKQHRRTKSWWTDVQYVYAEPRPSLDEALAMEADCIAVTNPCHNSQGRGPGQIGTIFGLFFGDVPSEQRVAALSLVEQVRRSALAVAA
jgi:hypothetical protein